MSGPAGAADKRLVVLIVEDDPNTAELIAIVSRDEGWYPVIAGNGAEAIARARQVVPALVVLDLMLPDEDGIQVGRQLAELYDPPLSVLAMSASKRDQAEFAGAVGAFDSLEKPFELDDLVGCIRRGLDRDRLAGD